MKRYLLISLGLVGFVFVGVLHAEAAITPGTGTGFSSFTPGTFTTSVTVAAGSNPVLFVSIGHEFGSISSVTYNGVALTQLWDQIDGANIEHSSAWILANPSSGTNILSITWSGGDDLAGFAQPWYGVAQGGTQGSTWRTPTFGNDGGGGSATASEVASNAVAGDMVLDSLVTYNQSPTAGGSQTSLNTFYRVVGNQLSGGTSNESATGATTMSWTFASTYWAYGVVPLIPAVAGPPDTTPPSTPTNLAVTGTTGSTVSLSWTASTDNVGVTGYDIYQGGTSIGTAPSASYTATGLSASTNYSFTVDAFDAAGNKSGKSTSVSATTQAASSDTTPPSVPTNLSASSVSSSQINLSWNASTDNVGVTGYDIYRNGVQVGTAAVTNFSDTGLTASTQYTYNVSAFDAAGNNSGQSSSASATTQAQSGGGSGCTGSGLAWSCSANSSLAQINATIASAPNGATLTLGAGTYNIGSLGGGAAIEFNTTKGLSIVCATPPSNVGSATTNQCLMDGVGPTFGSDQFSGVNNNLYRISGFTFDLQGGAPSLGTIYWDSYNGPTHIATLTQVRVDHNTFQDGSNGAQTTLIGSGGQSLEVYGSYDHNLYTNATQMAAVIWIGGVNPNPPASQLGTGNNLFIENNTFDYASVGNASAEGCTDGWGGSAYVVRYNTSINCLWTVHGATHAGGPANYEFYDNNVTMNAGSVSAGVADCYRCFHSQGSGEFIGFNNSFTAYSGKNGEVISMADYRSFPNSIDGGAPQCDGTVTDPPDEFSDGNRLPQSTYEGYPCWHQPGRDFAGNLEPMYVWNNYWSDTGGQIPLDIPDFGGTPDYLSNHLQANRDYYNAVSASAQTSPTSPFNGTTGMGFGTLANRPTTCTTDAAENQFDKGTGGVGYFATDVGSQGTLYQCSSANTWTVWYVPYTYPYPLVTAESGGGGGGSGGGGDTTPPTTSVTSPANNATVSSTVSVTATASDNVGVTQVQFYLDGSLQTTDTASPYTWSWNTTTASNGSHTLTTKAFDAAGNVGTSANVSVTVNNAVVVKPAITSSLTANGTVGTAFSYQITGSNSPTSYSASNLPAGLAVNTGTGLISGTPTAAATTNVTIGATNSAGTGTATLVITVASGSGGGGDTTPPSVPTGLSVSGTTTSTASLSWNASTDNVGVTGYKIYRGGTQVGTSVATNYTDAGLAASTTFSYTVSAFDAAGNTSAQSSAVNATTKFVDTTAPTVSLTNPANNATVSSTVTVTATASDNVGVTSVQFTLDGSALGAPVTTAPYQVFWNTLSTTTGTHTLSAVASDAAGNQKTSAIVTVTVVRSVDTTPPSVPTGLTATVQSVSQINLSWTASTDNVGVVGYKIFRGGTQVATSSGTTFANTGLAAATTYTYTVEAYDAAGNTSPQSTSASATTLTAPDTTPPTTSITSPANNATVAGSITVTATASDNVGVSKVEFYVDGALQTTDTSAPYTFTLNTVSLTNGTHILTTKAYDAAGNTGTSGNVTVTANNIPQTLTASLSANPTGGTVPISLSLTATAGGTAQGTLNYIFYCNRSDTGINITSPADLTLSAVTSTSELATNICTYQTAGTYTAKVIIEQGLATPVQAQEVITVNAPASSGGSGGGSGGGGSTGSSGGSSGGGGGGGSSGGGSVTPPSIISNVTVSEVTQTSAQVAITMSQPATVIVQYGPNTNYGQTSVTSPLLSTVFENLTTLSPATVYDFRVVATPEGSASPIASQNYLFTTQGTSGTTGTTGTTGTGGNSGSTTTPAPVPFPRNLYPGDTGSDVLLLQTVLKNLGYFASTFSPTTLFGTLTEHALLLFQNDHLLNRSGFVDLQTQALLNKVVETTPSLSGGLWPPKGTTTTTTPATTPAATGTTFTENLSPGSTGSQVTALQTTLNQNGDYPQDLVTGYYGSLTEVAVKTFQAQEGIVNSGTPATTGYGAVGPRTRAKLNSL